MEVAGPLGTPLGLAQRKRASPRGEAGTSGFLSVSDSDPPTSGSLQSWDAKSLQSWPTLCDPRDGSPPGSPVPGILQARILEWVAISFSNA